MIANDLMDKGIKLFQLGNFEDGIDFITKAIELEPNDPEKRQIRAIFYVNVGKCQEAILEYKVCIFLRDTQYEYYYNLANVYYDTNQYGIAIDYYSSAIKLNQNDSAILTNRGICYLKNNDQEQALNDFKKALSINPDDEIAKQNMTNLLLEIKAHLEAYLKQQANKNT